jgi:multimeric flavodoxin WrbA
MPAAAPLPARAFLFLLASGRKGGNTEMLARAAAESLPEDTAQTWLHLADLPLPAFEDLRHDPVGYPQSLDGSARTLFDATMTATDLVFVAPVYWYGFPAGARLYLDHWTHWLRIDGAGFKEALKAKTFWLISTQTAETLREAEPHFAAMKLVTDYCSASWGGSVIGYASAPGDVLKDTAALADARRLFADGCDLASSFA